ncbi:hypothetical protein [Thiopseudomonas acetoxidans]|uniref:Uncharacterized protein n=1 Tax=Thiopseudomonas acetoxidans TaxID=3041622 RepID=A0ABT7SNG6_9GAMM|nr:hypothetical protein [Thiopseudomonas sp. CY1220]MDM7857730.1 hypothetical protein [Thiopseudomonas sp. CY1220]
MSELQKKAGQTFSEVKYSHINWGVHMLPTIKQAADEFNQELSSQELPPVKLLIHSEESKGRSAKKQELMGDQIEFYYDAQPIDVPESVPGRDSIVELEEEKARLVFSQSLSGGISAEIYPPHSEIAHPVKESYVVNSWENPGLIGKDDILDLLRLTTKLNAYCGSINYPNPTGYKLLAKLEAKDAILSQGKSKLWTWINYYTRDSKAGGRFYSREAESVEAAAVTEEKTKRKPRAAAKKK